MISVASIEKWLRALLTAFLIVACAPVRLPEGTVVTGITYRTGWSVYETTFVNYDSSRLCYMYKIPGDWRPAGEPGLLRSWDGRALAGVFLWSESDLARFEGPDLISRAAKQVTQNYERRIGHPLTSTQLVPFESSRLGAMKWIASWSGEHAGKPSFFKSSKVFIEITPTWVAQITVQVGLDPGTRVAVVEALTVAETQNDDGLTEQIVKTLGTSSDPNCYRELRQKLQ